MADPLADPEHALALSYAPPARRAALHALWGIDERFGAIVAGTSEAAIGEMRLLWWREALEREAGAAPAEPLLREIDALVKPLGIGGEEIGAMVEGWHALLHAPLGRADIKRFARERGGRLFALSARLLGGDDAEVARAGEGWALVDLA
ncbi:MAG: squalene/phytoene synthase family protein, partial [Sphingomonadaceae bacterium]|nr:squalene/phytoene synthase family protein [Sphingomonadaceae bacterium]